MAFFRRWCLGLSAAGEQIFHPCYIAPAPVGNLICMKVFCVFLNIKPGHEGPVYTIASDDESESLDAIERLGLALLLQGKNNIS